MGTNNRARRAAKSRDRQRRSSGRNEQARRSRGGGDDEPGFSTEALIGGLVDLAPVRLAGGDRQFAEQAAWRLLDCPRRMVVHGIEDELLRAVARLFAEGWQPAEVVRQARRNGGATHASLVASAIWAHHVRAPAEPVDPRWQRQLDSLASVAVCGINGWNAGWFANWSEFAVAEPMAELMETFAVLVTVRSLPLIDQLIPPPGSRGVGAAGRATDETSDAERRLLDRVRHLLDKAESTEFEAEAEALTAKAHELITRHAIDMALLAGLVDPAADEQPMSVRVAIDDPYADAKSLLLQVVAGANRCRTVFHTQLAFSAVLGFPADVAATELLYTSLLVQAQTALASAARKAPPGARTRSRSYRSAFLVAYANRIGQRLALINEHLVAESDTSGSALPVLRSREAAVEDAVAARFPGLVSSAVRGGDDAAGWVGGHFAADQAQLNFADLTDDDSGGSRDTEPAASVEGPPER
jgi:hypothetical protein